MTRTVALALVALVVGLGVAACGDDSDVDETTTAETTTTEEATTDDDTTTEETTTEETTTTEEETAAGQAVFVANCGSCHVFADAGTSGAVGPSLDDTGLSRDEVEQQVRAGGGGMPAFEGQLSDEEIEQVSDYVSD